LREGVSSFPPARRCRFSAVRVSSSRLSPPTERGVIWPTAEPRKRGAGESAAHLMASGLIGEPTAAVNLIGGAQKKNS
jgi:hypothetical protein